MDIVTQALLNEFCEKREYNINNANQNEYFENFVNYAILLDELGDEFEIDETITGDGEVGIDGIAIVVNGCHVIDAQAIEDLAKLNGYVEAEFIFIQTTTTASFDTGKIATFCLAVDDFFQKNPKFKQNSPVLTNALDIKNTIYNKYSSKMVQGNPACKLFFSSQGNWKNDANLVATIDSFKKKLEDTGLFSRVEFTIIDKDKLQQLYRQSNNKVESKFKFERKISLPSIGEVKQSYLGIIPAKEYLKLIIKDEKLLKYLFYDNVRDYKGENAVNGEIESTIRGAENERFCLMNNGITIVAKELITTGDDMVIKDYQIVNGCQTSHVLYHNKEYNLDKVFIPIKIIETNNPAVRESTIRATNRQTEVKAEEFESLKPFHRALEDYFLAIKPESQKLFYERRSRQYNGEEIPKNKIIDINSLIRSFASMFLDDPNTAGRYPRSLLKESGSKMFQDGHKLIMYYTSSYTLYKIENMFRKGDLDKKYKKFKYYILMILRYQLATKDMPQFGSKDMEKYCNKILDHMTDDEKSIAAAKAAVKFIDNICDESKMDRDNLRSKKFASHIHSCLHTKPFKYIS